jgi:hypothetical protein
MLKKYYDRLQIKSLALVEDADHTNIIDFMKESDLVNFL